MEMSLVLVAFIIGGSSAFPSFDFFQKAPAYHNAYQPSDCVYSEWTPWSPCSAACQQPGFSSRSRVILEEGSKYGGSKCDTSRLEEWRDCFGEQCAADCIPADWQPWGACSSPCGPGERHRSRGVLSDAVGLGAPCDFLDEVETCDNGPCAQDCVQWSPWSACNSPCGPGMRDRSRFTISECVGGRPCGPSSEWENCDNGPCPQDCAYDSWGAWSQCPSCGPGSRSRSRNILQDGRFGGLQCDFSSLTESEPCPFISCAVDCVEGQWGRWSACSSDCGPGQRSRHRPILVQPSNGGRQCGPCEEFDSCDNGPCAQDCAYSSWESWSPCPSCGQASRSRSRQIVVEGRFGGLQCDFSSLSETEQCPFVPCSVDCEMSQWCEWSSCSSPCGPGQRDRSRSILTYPQNGGRQCGETEQRDQCNNGPCAQDCAYSDWGSWSPCPPCGQASHSRSRQIFAEGRFGGIQCDFSALSETEQCPFIPCSVDCEMSQWSQWSSCSSPCGSGQRDRSRSILTQPRNGGRQCGETEQWESCDNGPCAQDCAYSTWQSWSPCPSCGGGSRSRSRQIIEEGRFGGQQCEFSSLAETESCPFVPCAVDCEMGSWSPWGACSAPCGPGSRDRTRPILTQPRNGGRSCGETEQWESCNNGPCAQDCVQSQWTEWGPCSVTCGDGTRQRTRSTLSDSAFGGSPCGPCVETEPCKGSYPHPSDFQSAPSVFRPRPPPSSKPFRGNDSPRSPPPAFRPASPRFPSPIPIPNNLPAPQPFRLTYG